MHFSVYISFISFVQPYWLWLLFLLPLLVLVMYVEWRRRKRIQQQLGNAQLIAPLLATPSATRWWVKHMAILLAFVSAVIALAQPGRWVAEQGAKKQGIDVVWAIDVSRSMLSSDVTPSRLLQAKQLLQNTLPHLTNHRVGLVVFAGEAMLQIPLTTDVAAAQLFVNSLSTQMVNLQGTQLSSALRVADNALNVQEKNYKAIVLVTDGETHNDNLTSIIQQLKAHGTVVFCYGIGTETGSTIIDAATNAPMIDANGQPVVSKLNEAALRQIAESTGGAYQMLTNPEADARGLVDALQQIPQKWLNGSVGNRFEHQYQVFVLISIIGLLLAWWLQWGMALRQKQTRLVVLSIMLLGASNRVIAQAENTLVQTGNNFYRKGNFEQAKQQYLQALQQDSTLPEAQFNLGNTYLQLKTPKAAVTAYQHALQYAKSNAQKAAVWYNLGMALAANQQLEAAANAFKQSLLLVPTDNDARDNYTWLQQQLQKKSPKQQQQQPKKQPQQNKLDAKAAAQMLEQLRQQEQQLQKKLNQKSNIGGQLKDW
ncbi:MAG: VWA domain-containing protein [Chitinophagaceae bacterium]